MESRVQVALFVMSVVTQCLGAARVEGAPETSQQRLVSLETAGSDTNGIRLDFHSTQVDPVLDYLSATAHLVIHKETDPHGSIDLQSSNLVTVEAAVQSLNSALKRLGCAASLDGRILTVVSLESSKTSDLEVVTGSDPAGVEKSDRVVTQIIPVRYAAASQLLNNLQALLPTTATLSVNESANSLILVATQTQIRRMLRIISAVDTSLARVTVIRVVPLRYADAKQLASVIQQLFSSSQSSGGNNPLNFLGGFGPPGPGGPPGSASSSDNSASPTAASKITAVADEQSNSLILNASSDHLPALLKMVKEIDRPVTDVTELRLFNLRNADPAELADELAQLFGTSTQSSDQNQSVPQFGGGPPGGGGGPGGFGGPGGGGPPGFAMTSDTSGTSTRSIKKGQVLVVPDSRTSSLLVSAASTLMPQIAKMVEQLDANAARKELVQVYDLHHADPHDVNQVLQDLFNRNGSTANNNGNDRSSLLGQGNPLTSRATQQQNGTTAQNSGLGNSSGRGGQGTGSGSGGF